MLEVSYEKKIKLLIKSQNTIIQLCNSFISEKNTNSGILHIKIIYNKYLKILNLE